MNKNIRKLKKNVIKVFKVTRNIVLNGFGELFSSSKIKKINYILSEYKFVITASAIIGIFICKNFYTIYTYNKQITQFNIEIQQKTSQNKQLEEDLKYYKTDEFVLRYALEELNLRPTKDSPLYHGEVLKGKDEKNTNENTEITNIESNKPTEDSNTNSNQEDSANTEDISNSTNEDEVTE